MPVETCRAGDAFATQARAQICVINQPRERGGEGGFIKRIDEQTSVAQDFRETRPVACDDRRAATHGFERGQTEALEVRRIDKAECARIERGQVPFRHVARQVYLRRAAARGDSAKSFII